MNPTEVNDNDEIFHESHSFQSLTLKTSTISQRKSLTLLTVTPNIPIPPSLRQSPYLTSPIFSQAFPSPTPPSEEDEKWLQDTIPIASQARQPVVLATEGGCPQFVKGSLQRRGSIIQLSKRAAQKNGIIVLSGGEAKQGGESKNNVKDGDGKLGIGLGVGVSGQTGVASPSLLSADPHNSHGLWPSTHNRRRRSASPRRPEPFNMDETFPFRS